ncbi:MAG TPA: hypothetical protein VGE74_06565 [Gemmata sp.]
MGGTPIQGEHGAKPIEQFKSYEEHGDNCDLVVSRDEHNGDGALTLRRVLRTVWRANDTPLPRRSGRSDAADLPA